MEETTLPQPGTVAEPPAPEAPPPDGGAAQPAETPLDKLQKELDEAQAKAAENLDGWQRERAAFANYKRRIEKELADANQNAAGRVIARYLDVLDDFDRAMKDQPAEGDAARWAEGVALIYRKFQNLLEAEGVTRIEAEGKEFDPNLHEAVMHDESEEHPAGHVTEVLRQGYKLGDKVIRPALVRVAK